MQLTMFPSDKGDCLLLESGDPKAKRKRVLCDGGMRNSFAASVADELSKRGGTLDAVYVSHVDDDHIAGVLKLLQDSMEWKVFDFHHKNGGDGVKKPKVPRPPKIVRLWHNAFHDVIKQNAGKIDTMLAAMAPMLSSTEHPELRSIGDEQRNLITSKAQAIEVSQLVSPEELGIPVNNAPKVGGDHRFMMARNGAKAIPMGSMRMTIIGPFEEDLDAFRKEWNQWLKDNQPRVTELRAKAKRQAGVLTNDVDTILAPFVFKAVEFGDRKKVTLPNLCSLMFFVEDDDQTLILTGDGHADDVLKGLEQTGKVVANGDIHVDILKVQHHGSEHNIHAKFCRRVSADHYVFCGNGFSGNPELSVLELIYDSRFGRDAAKLATNAKANGRHVKFWFNAAPQRQSDPDRRAHMTEVQQMCERWERTNPLFEARFMAGNSLIVQ